MTQLADLNILNLIDQLPRRTAYLELRELGQCDSATLHRLIAYIATRQGRPRSPGLPVPVPVAVAVIDVLD